MKYKFLLFDLDNTLLDFDLAEDTALTKLLEKQGVEDIELYKQYYSPMNKDLWHQLDEKKITRDYLVNNRFKILFSNFGLEVDGKMLASRYEQLLGEQGQHLEGAIELLDTLSKKYKIYAATNGLTSIQKNRLKNAAITKYFDKIFISEEIGYQKPDVKFFEFIEKHIPGFIKENSVMIGDNLFADIGGGVNFGIDTIWCNYKNIERKYDITPTYEVRSIDEIKKLLD